MRQTLGRVSIFRVVQNVSTMEKKLTVSPLHQKGVGSRGTYSSTSSYNTLTSMTSSLVKQEDPFQCCWSTDIKVDWIRSSSTTSTTMATDGRFAWVCHMRPHCRSWEIHQSKMGNVRLGSMEKSSCYCIGSLSGAYLGLSTQRT